MGTSLSSPDKETCYTNAKKMGAKTILLCSTKESDVLHVRYEFNIPKDISSSFSSFSLGFKYNFITQEYPARYEVDNLFISQEYPGFGVSDWDTIELSIKSANGKPEKLVAKASDDISMKEDVLHMEIKFQLD
ncbi:MAG: hypothetical protein QM487_13050 [Candidatus Marithrix sp.]